MDNNPKLEICVIAVKAGLDQHLFSSGIPHHSWML